jgi:hypothetical protein
MLDAIKFMTLIISAMLGVYGSFFTLKNSSNKISKHGWACILGILVCASTSAVLQIISDGEGEKKTIKLLEQNNQLLENANRNLTPLSPLILTISLRPDLKLKTLAPFVAKLEQDQKKLFSGRYGKNKFSGSSFGSVFMPSPQSKLVAPFFESVCSQNVSIVFFKNHIDVSNFEYSISPDYQYDLMFDIYNPCSLYSVMMGKKPLFDLNKVGRIETVFLSNKLLDAHMEFEPVSIAGTDREWSGSGSIVSVLDLLNSTMIIQLHNSSADIRDGFSVEEVGDLRRKTNLIEMKVKFPNGVLLAFDEDNLVRHTNKRGEPYYSFTFPSSLKELMANTKYDPMKLIEKTGFSDALDQSHEKSDVSR